MRRSEEPWPVRELRRPLPQRPPQGRLPHHRGPAHHCPLRGTLHLLTAADYLGWQDRQGVSLFAVQLGWAFVVSLLALFGSAIYVAIELGRDGRRVRSR